MANVTSTIGSDPGDDYATIGLWESDKDGNPDTLSPPDRYVGTCREESFAERVIFSGWSTGLVLKPMDGHEGTLGNRDDGVRIRANDLQSILISDTSIADDWNFTDLKMDGRDSVASRDGFRVDQQTDATNSMILTRVTSYDWTGNAFNLGTGTNTVENIEVRNCVGFASNQGSDMRNAGSGNLYDHCLFYNNTNNGVTTTGLTVAVTNTLGLDNGASDFSLSGTVTENNNGSSDATAGGTGSLTNLVTNDELTDAASEEFWLKSGASAEGAGEQGFDMGAFDGPFAPGRRSFISLRGDRTGPSLAGV